MAESTCWMTLSEASNLLGVHPTTLRRWADQREVPCFRTPGGHRRFREEDLRAFLDARRRPVSPPAAPEALVQDLVQRTRRDMREGSVAREPWHAAFDEADRAARRQSGRRLLGLAIQYTLRATGRERILEEGRRIGRQYGQDAARRGLSLVDTSKAFLFFRETLIRATRPGLLTRGQYDAEDVHIHRSVREFLDQVLFAMLEAYERATYNLLPGRTSE